MTTITEALSETIYLKAENEHLTQTLSSMIAENEHLKQILRTVKKPVMQANIDAINKEIQMMVDRKAEVYTKPLSDIEKAALAGMHQRKIETVQAEKLALEQDKAALDALIVPV